MSDEDGEEIRINAYDENEEDEDEDNEELTEEQGFAAQPVEIVREEIVTVTKDPYTQEKISVVDDTRGDDDSDDLYELVRAHSVQLNKLTDIVESLQAQIKQLRETRKSSRKTTPTTRNPMKSKKKKASAKKAKGRSSKKSKT
jgi:Ni2+-binding GTPase involved in maturation of urease and hydrogenase